ncbi:Dps family protein [Phaeacidiphilus oryzae]|uniref:Dps family protein n=1 Tax=Phaeacidiphilus oryzae TaxID=348818 RepID=UPI000566AD46|nr:DNA starvation/stationary phase protection protein [Phaeacidiphilus oryzae]
MTTTTATSGKRRTEADASVGFTASRHLAEALQQVLVDLVELHLQGKQAHWNVIGHNFRDLHLQLDEVVDEARGQSDTIAERMRALGAVPDARTDVVAATTTLPAFPEGELDVPKVVDLTATRLHAAADTCRKVHDGVDSEDPTTADQLHQIIENLEKLAWMVRAENRSTA